MDASENPANFGHGGRWRRLRVTTLLKASSLHPSPCLGYLKGNFRSRSPRLNTGKLQRRSPPRGISFAAHTGCNIPDFHYQFFLCIMSSFITFHFSKRICFDFNQRPHFSFQISLIANRPNCHETNFCLVKSGFLNSLISYRNFINFPYFIWLFLET
jgi:hypothetical protein